MAQMKEQIKAPKIELIDEEIANLSDIGFKALVIRMLTEMVEYDHKIKEKVKAIQSEPTVKGRKLGLESTIWRDKKMVAR